MPHSPAHKRGVPTLLKLHGLYEATPVDLSETHGSVTATLSSSKCSFSLTHTSLSSPEEVPISRTPVCVCMHAVIKTCRTFYVFKWVGIYLGGCLTGMHCNKQMLSLYEVFTTGSAPCIYMCCVRVCVSTCMCTILYCMSTGPT